MLYTRSSRRFSVAALALATLASGAFAQSVAIQSGNGAVDGPDSLITYEVGPASSDFGPLQPSDFAAAQAGPAAYILDSSELSAFWAQPTSVGPTCEWIGTSALAGTTQSTTALYAVPFTWQTATANSYLDITFSVDDQLGSAGAAGDTNVGIYIDGNPLANTDSNVDWGGGVQTYFLSLGALSAGTHYLYFDDDNAGGGPAGLIFQGSVVPEPASYVVLGVGALGLLRLRRRR